MVEDNEANETENKIKEENAMLEGKYTELM